MTISNVKNIKIDPKSIQNVFVKQKFEKSYIFKKTVLPEVSSAKLSGVKCVAAAPATMRGNDFIIFAKKKRFTN